jgi:hypothetical protein
MNVKVVVVGAGKAKATGKKADTKKVAVGPKVGVTKPKIAAAKRQTAKTTGTKTTTTKTPKTKATTTSQTVVTKKTTTVTKEANNIVATVNLKKRCQGLKKDGTQCTKDVAKGKQKYCGTHSK